jgi:hypothetical protein
VLIVGNGIAETAAGLIDLFLAAGGELVTVLTGARSTAASVSAADPRARSISVPSW